MKRLLAGLLVLCSLLFVLPAALAAPGEDAPAAAETPVEGETTEELPAEGEAAPETETPENQEAQPPAQPEKKTDPDQEALASETAIDRMEVRIYIDDDGYAVVNQRVEMHIIGSLEEIRFSFPEGAKKCDVEGFWTSSSSEHGLKYLTVKNRKGFSGNQTFQLSYTIRPTIAGGEASQIMTLPLLSLQDYKIGYYIFQANLPKTFTAKPYFSSGYYGDLVEELMSVVTEEQTITAAVNQIVRDNDTLAMTLVLPEKYFSGSYGESRLSPIMTGVIVVILLFTLFYWYRTMRNHPLRINGRSLPPDGITPGDMPFLLSGGQADFNLLVTHWAILGYLSFYVNRGGNILLQRRMDMGNERRPFERRLFDLLFAGNDICDGASLRYKKVGAKAVDTIPLYWKKRLYERRSGSVRLARSLCYLCCALATMLAMDAVGPSRGHFLYLVLGLAAGAAMGWIIARIGSAWYLSRWPLFSAGIICALLLLIVGGLGGATYVMLPSVALTAFLGWQTAHGGRRKAYGNEVLGQALGFRRFMQNATEEQMLQMLRRDPQYFYKILPYAEAMGLGRKYVLLFQNARLEPCQWYESAREVPAGAQAFYARYLDMLDLLNISLKK